MRPRPTGRWCLALALCVAPLACAGADTHAGPEPSTPAVAPASQSSTPPPAAAPPTACSLLSAAEMSRIVGTDLTAEGEEATGTTTCTYKPRGGGFGYIELKVDWGGGEAALTAMGMMGRMEPGIAASLTGVGDRAVRVGPALWIRTGEDLVTLTIFGIDRGEDTPRRVIALMRPRMGPTSQPAVASATGGGATPEALPKEAQAFLGGVLGMLGQQQPGTTAGDGSGSGGEREARTVSGSPTPRPAEPAYRSAVGLAPRRIPLVPGLTLVSAIHERDRGDYEPTLVVRDVTSDAISLTFSASLPEGDDLSVPRTVRLEDFRRARKARTWFQDGDPEEFPGTTPFGMSVATFAQLKASRDAAFELYSGGSNPLLGVVSSLLGGGPHDDGEWRRGTLTRVEPYALAIPVLVNDEPVELPAIHARGMLGDERFDYYVLDDPELPLVLRSAGRNVLQMVRLAFPVAAESPAAALEARLKKDGRAEVYGIYFDFSKSTLRPESERVLAAIAEVLRDNPDWTLNVEGHTDNIGGDAYNLDLSRQRSTAVARALVDRHRIAGDRLTTSGFGASRPKASNDTLSGRAQNRRVELVRR